MIITLVATELESHEYYIPSADFKVLVKKKDVVHEKQVLAKSSDGKNKITAAHAGIIEKLDANTIVIKDEEPRVKEYSAELGRNVLVKKGDMVKIGEKLTEGHIDTHNLMELAGILATEDYIIKEVKAIYSSQGQTVNSKHIEIIVRQMFAKVKILAIGDSSFFPGDVVEMVTYKKENDRLIKAGQKPAVGHSLLLGLTKASLYTESWLAAASFQETVRVLVDASVSGKIDVLSGLKENVIIGRLIPTLQYFGNNQNVGDYFDYHGADDEEIAKTIHNYSGKVNEGDLEAMAFDED
jgi:DNA-directed RNA polymerase subunit beta'